MTDRMAQFEGKSMTDARRETLRIACELGVSDDVLNTLANATRVNRGETITLPARYLHLSRARGWARKGKGDTAEWGEKDGNGFRVGPGKWLVFSTDGFRREERVEWTVKHVAAGDQTWTIAD